MNKLYRRALAECLDELGECVKPRGMERVIQCAVARCMSGSLQEVPLRSLGGIPIEGVRGDEGSRARVDVLHGKHAIELKVVRMPRVGSSSSNALYDVGQLTADYWRLSTARDIDSAELLILAYGPLVSDLAKGSAICRELHNRLYVDLRTSLAFSELGAQKQELRRKRQISAAKQMGVWSPCDRPLWSTFVAGEFALVCVPVLRK